jgi:lipopolysaccharide export system permease protein
MKLIERYIFRRVFALTMSALLVATGILLTTQLLTNVDMVTRSADAAVSFAVLALTLVPTIALLVAPFALLIGIIRTLNTMNTDSELAVLEAAGRAPAATARPVVMLAALMTLASLVAAHTIEPWSNRKLQDTIAEASADLIRSAVQSGSFVKVSDNLFIQIGKELPSGEYGQIVIVDARDPVTEVIYYAQRGVLTESDGVTLFVLADGEVHRRNNSDRSVSIISFATSALDFSQFLGHRGGRGHRPEELATSYLLSPAADDPLMASRPAELRKEIHRRFSEWLFPLAFGLIAVYFVGSARSSRQEQPVRIALGAVTALVVRALGFFTVAGSGESALLAALTYAVPLVTIALFGGLILGSRAMHVPKNVMEGASSAGAGMFAMLGGALRATALARGGRRR